MQIPYLVHRGKRAQKPLTMSRETLLIACGYSIDDTPVDPIPLSRSKLLHIHRDYLAPKLFIHLPRPSSVFQLLPFPSFLPSQPNVHPSSTLLRLVLLGCLALSRQWYCTACCLPSFVPIGLFSWIAFRPYLELRLTTSDNCIRMTSFERLGSI